MAASRTQREREPPDSDAAADPATIVRHALKLLDDVDRLLEALSPAEIESTVSGGAEAHWKLYASRHRVFTLAFERQRALFAELASKSLKHARSTPPPPSGGSDAGSPDE
jgi:hypothetical protein